MPIVPSYILKADQAERHLHALKLAIREWTDSHPYALDRQQFRRRSKYSVRFTSEPPPLISLLAADFVYNIRSGLDHLMGDLVPPRERGSVYFPIYFAGVWEPDHAADTGDMPKYRGRWRRDTANIQADAVEILKSLQPRTLPAGKVNVLQAINALSNLDRHQRLPVTFTALRGLRLVGTDRNTGQRLIGPTDTGDPAIDSKVVKDGSEVQFPAAVTDRQIVGQPLVAITLGQNDALEIPELLDDALTVYRDRVVKPLAPHIWTT